MGFRADARAAVVSFLEDYAADDPTPGIPNSKMTVYPARPSSINPPHGFVDSIRGTIDYTGPIKQQLTYIVDAYVLHGLFDSKVAVDHADAFVDGINEWQRTRYHEAGANTTIGLREVEDIPTFVPDWLDPKLQRTYYATRLSFEVYAGN